MFAQRELQVGVSLPVIIKVVTQEMINRYARVSHDTNPIHIDPDFAQNSPLGGTVAHGMLVLAFISQMMTEAFGQAWYASGFLNVRFKAPARPGDTLSVIGKLVRLDAIENEIVVTCEVVCQNQNQETVITGDAGVRLANDNIG
jgi:acyl dehydratase